MCCTIGLVSLICDMPTRWTTLHRPTDFWLNSERLCTGRLIPDWTLIDFAQADWFLAELWPILHRPTDSWLNSGRFCTGRLIPDWTLVDFAQADWFLAEIWPTLHWSTDSWLNSDRLCTGRLIPGWILTDLAQADWFPAELRRPLPKSHTTESWLIKFLLLVSDLPKPNHLTSNHPFKLIFYLFISINRKSFIQYFTYNIQQTHTATSYKSFLSTCNIL
jgi:hypothetical protein